MILQLKLKKNVGAVSVKMVENNLNLNLDEWDILNARELRDELGSWVM